MRVVSLLCCLILLLSGCMLMPPESAWPSSSALSAAEAAASTVAPLETPIPAEISDLDVVLPLNENTELVPLTWDGEIPVLPELEAWSYRKVGMKNDYDVDSIWRNLYGDTPYVATQRDNFTNYYPPKELQNEPCVRVSTCAATKDWYVDALYIEMEFPGKFPGYEPIPYTFDEAAADAKALVEHALGTGEYTDALSSRAKYYAEGRHETSFSWAQTTNGISMVNGGSVDALYFYIGRGMANISITRMLLDPEQMLPSIEPVTFEQALYALNYNRSMAEGELDRFYQDCPSLIDVGIVYSKDFCIGGDVFAPAWVFTLENADGYSEYEFYVDMESGEVYGDVYSWERYPSPFPNRPSSPAYIKETAENEKNDREFAALFPLVFAQADGYSYYLKPADGDIPLSEIWRRNNVTGEETLLDGNARYHYDDTVKSIRAYMYAALIGDRIVFIGYDAEDWLMDYKRGGQLVSIALDGSDKRLYNPKLNVFSSLCVDGDRLYYIGWSGNDPSSFSLNYVDPLLSKDRAYTTLDKRFICISDGVIYAIDHDAQSNIIYRKNGEGWEVYRELLFNAENAVSLLESGAWRIYGLNGEEYDFYP